MLALFAALLISLIIAYLVALKSKRSSLISRNFPLNSVQIIDIKMSATANDSENPSVTRFRQFLRIKTVQPSPDYASCTAFLVDQARQIGLESRVVECVKGKPIVIMTWVGTDPKLKSVMLNCHTDVVPVFPEQWTHDPFAADKLANGDIIARGAQDMKCVGSWYMEAIRDLKSSGYRPRRTVHVVFVPDEEIGGHDGMVELIKTEEFRKLNVAFALDEGLANAENAYKVYYGERAPWWIKITATGGVGHGSQFIHNTAAAKIQLIINKLLEFRRSEEMRLQYGARPDGRKMTLGDVTTCNLTIMKGGVQYNVVPETFEVGFDIRVSPSMNMPEFRKTLLKWVEEAGCKLEFVQECKTNAVTKLDDSNPFWCAIRDASKTVGVELQPEIFPAATDSRYLREIGVPAIGISPIKNTKVLLHDHNEYLNEKVFLDGIEWYKAVLTRLFEVESEPSHLLQ